jgi:DNA-binding NarL/FixJ family response regulator
LIVDDHQTFRDLAARLLVSAGFTVVGGAGDAATALRQVAELQPDAVLLDVGLPDRSGLLVAEELARQPNPPRVVLVSSRTRSDFGSGFAWPERSVFLPKHELSAAVLTELIGGP